MRRKSLILIILLGLIILTATTQAIRPTFKGSPAACAWYTDTSQSNPYYEGRAAMDPGYIGRNPSVYDTLDVFVRSQDHKLLHYHLVPNRDYGGRLDGYVETVLPDQLICYSSPAVVQTGPHTIHVFVWSAEARTVNGRRINHLFLMHLTWDANHWSLSRIEGPEPSYYDTPLTVEELEMINSNFDIEDAMAPIATSSWGDDRIDLFVPGMVRPNPNWHLKLISGQPVGSWENIGQPGSQSLGIASGSWGPGRIDVFALCGDDRAYYHKSFVEGAGQPRVNGWDQNWDLVTQGVRFTSAPFINQVPLFPGAGSDQGLGFGGLGYRYDPNRVTLWGRGYANGYTTSDLQSIEWWHFSMDNNREDWIIPRSSPSAKSRPAAVNYIGDHVTVFVRWPDDTLWLLDYDLWCCQSDQYIWGPVPDLPEMVGAVGLGPLFLPPTSSTSRNITAEGQPSIILMVNNTNIPGSDYKNFSLKTDDPKLCAQVCIDDPVCMACTYVKPGYQGPDAKCWLKNGAPNQVHDECCQSGVKGAEAFLTSDQILEASNQPQVAPTQTVSKEGHQPALGAPAQTVSKEGRQPPLVAPAGSQGLATGTVGIGMATMNMMNNIDLPGLDLRDGFDLATADPNLCAQACRDDSQCMAWTYVKPTYQATNARCWLKRSVPSEVPSECCISGIK